MSLRSVASSRNHRFSGRVRIILVLSVLTLAVATAATAVAFERWRTSLHLFGGVGNIQGGPVAVGQTIYAGEYAWPTAATHEVHLEQASAIVTLNSAGADVKVMVCEFKPSARIGTIGMAFNARQYCASLHRFHPGAFALAPSKTDILLAVTPRRPGRVHIAGVQLSYDQGLRRGRQATGINVHTRTASS